MTRWLSPFAWQAKYLREAFDLNTLDGQSTSKLKRVTTYKKRYMNVPVVFGDDMVTTSLNMFQVEL